MIGSNFQETNQIRNHIVLFGLIFQGINVWRKDDRKINVPIQFASKEKFFAKINSEIFHGGDPRSNPQANIEQVLPRMGFNITNMQYKPDLKVPSTNYKSFEQPDGTLTSQFTPSPWEVSFQLSVYTRYEQDMLKIFEQIVPFFQPNITAKIGTEIDYPHVQDRSIHLTLTGVQPDEQLFGEMNERRVLVWNFDFIMSPVYIYPPSLSEQGVIRTIILDFSASGGGEFDVNIDDINSVEQLILGE